jgi:putative hydrolase of the HAD superfamily
VSWLLCDYGEVLSLPQPAADQRSLEEAAGWSGPGFWTAYWQYRPSYDRGVTSALEYWTEVLERRPERPELDRLVKRDVAGWLHPNHNTLLAATRAAQRGLRLAVLSNAPHEVADALDRAGWLSAFTPRLFSCRLGAIKPEPAIYLAALGALDAAPADVTFLDDRADNVSAARRAGIRACVFADPAQIDAIATPPTAPSTG